MFKVFSILCLGFGSTSLNIQVLKNIPDSITVLEWTELQTKYTVTINNYYFYYYKSEIINVLGKMKGNYYYM